MRTLTGILVAAFAITGWAQAGEKAADGNKPLPPVARQGQEAIEERKRELLAEMAKLQARIDAIKKELTEIENGQPLMMKGEHTTPPADKAKTMGKTDRSEKMQADRKKFIEGLIQRGVWAKVDGPGSSGGLPRIWIKAGFYALDFQDKQSIVGVVYAYYFDGNNLTDAILLIDNLSGKQVGSYNPQLRGLEME